MDFRKILRKNQTKTKFVIASFIIIMLMVGLLTDVVLNPLYPNSLTLSLLAFIKLKAIPYATISITLITCIGILLITKFGHKIMLSGTKYKKIEEQGDYNFKERQVYNMVEEMAISANLGYIPKVYIMNSDDVNAFATGWNEKNAIVCVTTGLIQNLDRDETQAVIAHEIAHILHGDSKLTLYVGILANVILTFTNIFAHIVFFIGNKGGGSAANKARILIIILNFILPIITQILYLYLSRSREYMADATAVRLTGDNQSMINALIKISGKHKEKTKAGTKDKKVGEQFRSAANIFETGDSIFSTHPSIKNRLKKLGYEIE